MPLAGRSQTDSARLAAACAAGIVSVLMISGCSQPIDTSIPTYQEDTTLPTVDEARRQMQEHANASMNALGDAYRQAIKDKEVSAAALVLLGDGYAGAARDAEEANLRDAIESRNSLARNPGAPELLIDIVTESNETNSDCMIAEAKFDDRPLLAFPITTEGIDVIVRMRQNITDELWRIDELVSVQQNEDNPLRCPLAGEADRLVPSTPTTQPLTDDGARSTSVVAAEATIVA